VIIKLSGGGAWCKHLKFSDPRIDYLTSKIMTLLATAAALSVAAGTAAIWCARDD
jgi:hypothetical protein